MKKPTILILVLLMCCFALFVSCDEKDKTPQETPPESTEEQTTIDLCKNLHKYGEWIILKEATRVETGEKMQICSVCGKEKHITISVSKEHTYGAWKETLAPTCTEKGSERRDCSVCDHFETQEINANGHTYNPVVTPPTVKDQGYTTHTCSACSDSYKDSFVPATGSLGLAYTVNSDGKTCTITGMGTCTDTEVYINEKIDGYTVTAIGEKAFAEKESIIFICIPNTVKTIGTRAFYGCSGITEITIPASVTSIGTQIFYKASALSTVYYNSTYASQDNPFLAEKNIETVVFGGARVPNYIAYNNTTLKNVIIQDGVQYVDNDAFYGCTNLANVTIGNSVTSIDWYAFYGCTSLTSITIPDSVTSIGYAAFRDCTSLTSITIPDSVTSIDSWAFFKCTNLKKVYYTGTIENWCNISFSDSDSNPTYNGAELYFNNILVTEVEIPDTITKINDSAFSGCTSLTSITIPDSVTSIGDSAFRYCTSLTSITIPNGVTSIYGAFSGCTSLTSITLGDSVTSIGGWAFSGCTSLTSITIPDSVTSIGYMAFSNCTNLKKVYYAGTAEQWAGISIDSYNTNLTNATRYYYSEAQPTTSGNYWRYVDGVPTAW